MTIRSFFPDLEDLSFSTALFLSFFSAEINPTVFIFELTPMDEGKAVVFRVREEREVKEEEREEEREDE